MPIGEGVLAVFRTYFRELLGLLWHELRRWEPLVEQLVYGIEHVNRRATHRLGDSDRRRECGRDTACKS